jgi:lambda family phage tail tape measure protein
MAPRFLKDYVAESNDAATATERAFANAFSGAEDSLVGFIGTGKLEFQGLADSILADLARTTVRQTITAPLAGALQSAFAGGGLFGLFHEGGIAGEHPTVVRYADAAVFDHAPRYHGGGFTGPASCRTRSRSSPARGAGGAARAGRARGEVGTRAAPDHPGCR